MTDEELQHLRRLRSEIQRRLNEQEIQAARMGTHTPVELTLEMRAGREEIERIDAKLRMPTISLAVQAATGPESYIDVLRARVEHVGDQVYEAMRWTSDQILEMREETRQWRDQQAIERRVGIRERRVVECILAIGVGIAIYLALR